MTGIVNTHKYSTIQEIEDSFNEARQVYKIWSKLKISERLHYIKKIKEVITLQMDYIIDNICRDTGKVTNEVLMSDILPVLDLIKYYEKNAAKILKTRKQPSPIYFLKNKAHIEYMSMGVIAVISPWNYPLQLALIPAITALIAGNTVILKPSEITPLIGKIIEKIFDLADIPWKIIHIVQGEKEAVKKIISLKPDKLFFTGSTDTGKKIMKLAADNLIPLQLELGGKDPMIVFEDANLKRAAAAAVYGSLANSGQWCVSIERVYVQETIYDEFIDLLKKEIKKVRTGKGLAAEMGPIIHQDIFAKVKEQLEDAVSKGAKLLTDFKREGNYLYPLLLKDVKQDMSIMQEETFGPVIPVKSFSTEEEAINLANDSRYGLNSSVWTEDSRKASRVVSQLIVGNCYVNDVAKNVGNPYLPFGGVKDSGFEKYHGTAGLKNFSIEKSVMINNSNASKEINWFPYTPDKYKLVSNMINFLYKKESLISKIRRIYKLLAGLIKSN